MSVENMVPPDKMDTIWDSITDGDIVAAKTVPRVREKIAAVMLKAADRRVKALRFTGDRERIAQEICMRALTAFENEDIRTKKHFINYFYKTAQWVIINEWNKRKQEIITVPIAGDHNGCENPEFKTAPTSKLLEKNIAGALGKDRHTRDVEGKLTWAKFCEIIDMIESGDLYFEDVTAAKIVVRKFKYRKTDRELAAEFGMSERNIRRKVDKMLEKLASRLGMD